MTALLSTTCSLEEPGGTRRNQEPRWFIDNSGPSHWATCRPTVPPEHAKPAVSQPSSLEGPVIKALMFWRQHKAEGWIKAERFEAGPTVRIRSYLPGQTVWSKARYNLWQPRELEQREKHLLSRRVLCINVSVSVSLFSVQMLVSSPAVMNYLNAEKEINCHPCNITCT